MPIINYLNRPDPWKQGIYDLKTYDDYARIPALRSSDLKKLDKSPLHFKSAMLHKAPISALLQRSFDKGSAFDTLMLHGLTAFENRISIEPKWDKRTDKYQRWKKSNQHLLILSQTEKEDILQMQHCAMAKKQFANIFHSPGHAHKTIIWQDSSTGIWCKAEIDWICSDGTVVDLKTAADASFWFFQRQASRLGYANQGAFYLEGLRHVTGIEHDRFFLAVVETSRPFESHVFRVGSDQLINAHTENQTRMEVLRRCLHTGQWPGYQDRIIDLESGHYEYDDSLDDMEENLNGF